VLPPRGFCSAGYLVALTTETQDQRPPEGEVALGYEIQSRLVVFGRKCRFRKEISQLCWIADGVLAQIEPLLPQKHGVFVQVFLSAQKLPTDISGLKLRETEEMEIRKAQALGKLATILETVSLYLGFVDEFSQTARRKTAVAEGLLRLSLSLSDSAGRFLAPLIWLSKEMAKRSPSLDIYKIPDMDEEMRQLKANLNEELL
jgi:hypothetical protein